MIGKKNWCTPQQSVSRRGECNQTGIIYHYQCPHINCPSSYIGESGRTLGDRIKEHFKAPSPIHLHSSTTGHPMDPNQFSIVHEEVNSQPRTIKEAMYIWVQDPPQQEHRKVPASTHLWPTSTSISYTPAQANQSNQPFNQQHSHLTPLLVTPLHSPLPLTLWWGAHQFFFPMVSTCMYPKYPPSPYLQQVLHQHHLGKFLHFIFVSLTFLSDLMKWLQNGC